MITLFTWYTPNGHKISIMLKEFGIPTPCRHVNLGAKEQFSENFGGVSRHEVEVPESGALFLSQRSRLLQILV
jgi:hypothetical protein